MSTAITHEIPALRAERDAPAHDVLCDAPAHDVLCDDEVAVWFCVDRKTVYNAAGRGDIPQRILFSRAALMSWLAREGGARRKEARDERSTR